MTETRTGKCHCGAVHITVQLEDGFDNLLRCNCSLCRRKGAIMAGVPLAALTVTKGADNLGCYQWNTRVAKHYFCKTCGIYTHHARRSNPDEYGINVGCFEITPDEFGDLPTADGAAMSVVESAE